MLKTKNIALLDIGSSKIELFYGSSVGNNCNVLAVGSEAYSGFANGQFFEPDKLKEIVMSVIRQVENKTGKAIKKLYVTVPGEFTKVVIRKEKESYPRPRPVNNSDFDRLLERAELSGDSDQYVNINTSLINYETDSFRPIDASGKDELVTRSIGATISCIMCDRSFIDLFDEVFNYTAIREVKYISSAYAEGMYLTSKAERDKGVLLCDIGYLTTTVMLVKGEGLKDMCSFSLGGAHIVADYTMIFDIDFKSAENLYNKVNLKIAPKGYEDYHVETSRGITKFGMSEVNNITFDRLDVIVDYIKKSIDGFGDGAQQFMPIYFTGGGIATCKGAIEYVAYNLNRKYDIRVPNVAQYNAPWFTTSIAALDVACRIEEDNSVLRKFVNKIIGGLR